MLFAVAVVVVASVARRDTAAAAVGRCAVVPPLAVVALSTVKRRMFARVL